MGSARVVKMAVRLTRAEVVKIIDDFIEGRSAAWDWAYWVNGAWPQPRPIFSDVNLRRVSISGQGYVSEFPCGGSG